MKCIPLQHNHNTISTNEARGVGSELAELLSLLFEHLEYVVS